MSGTIIKSARNTPNAPQDLGPYTQSVAFSHYNNIAAQLPVVPKTGALVAGLTIPSYERGVARLLRYDRHP